MNTRSHGVDPPGVPDRTRYLLGLDGIRALAVVAVVAFHLGFLRGGFLGVDLFFVISGFLITRLLLIEMATTGRVDLFDFWRRRFRRLLPVLFVVLAVTVVVAKQWMAPWRLSSLRDDSLAAIAYVANWRFSLGGESYFTQGIGPSPLRHTWSLAIEEQFYVLWPVMLVALLAAWHRWGPASRPTDARWRDRLVGRLALVVVVLSAVTMVVASMRASDLSSVYYGTHTRVFALAAGSWISTWWDGWVNGHRSRAVRRRRQGLLGKGADVGLVALVVMVFVAREDAAWMYQGGFQFAAVASTLVVAGVCTGRGRMAGLLESGPFRWVGRRSYGIYLWSWPIQVLVPMRFDLSRGRLAVVVAVSSVLLAWVSFALVETPLRSGRWPGTVAVRRVPGFAGLGFGAVAVTAAIVATTLHAPPEPDFMRISDEEAVAAALAPSRPRIAAPAKVVGPPGFLADGPPTPFDRSDPLLVPSDAPDKTADLEQLPRVVIAGDSVGWTLGRYAGGDMPEMDIVTRAVIGCGLMPTEGKWIASNGDVFDHLDLCDRQEELDGLAVADRPDVVLLWIGAWEVYDHQYQGRTWRVGTDEFAEVIERLLQQRIDRYKAGDIATVMPLLACFGGPELSPQPTWAKPRSEQWRVDWVNERIEAVAARNIGWVRLIDPRNVLCDDAGRFREQMPDGGVIRPDGAHFEKASAPWFWRSWLAGQIVAALD